MHDFVVVVVVVGSTFSRRMCVCVCVSTADNERPPAATNLITIFLDMIVSYGRRLTCR